MNVSSVIEVYALEFGRQIWIFGRDILSSDKQWAEVISTPMIIPNTDVDSCCLATKTDTGRLCLQSTEQAPKGLNLPT